MYSELVYSSSVRFSLAGEETNSVWNLVSLWVHGWVASDWYKYPEYWAQPKHPRKADILHSTFKRNKVTNVTTCFQQSLPTQDAFLSHCFIGSLDTSMNVAAWRRFGKLKSHSGVRSLIEHWSVERLQQGQVRYLYQVNLWFWIGSLV